MRQKCFPLEFGVKLQKPFRKYENNNDCRYGGPSITELFIEDNMFLLVIFDGQPYVVDGAVEQGYYKTKYSEAIGRMLEGTKVPHFSNLYKGSLREYEGDLEKATEAFLSEAAKWCNLDIKVLEGMYKASQLYDSSLDIPDEKGITPLHRKMRMVLLDRRIYHYNDVRGYIDLRYKLRLNLVTGRPELFDAKEQTFFPLEDSMLNTIYWENKQAGSTMSMSDLRYLIGSDFLEEFHPFKVYYEGLAPYDAETEPDHIELLANQVDAEDADYWIWCLRKWLVGVVATALVRKLTNHQVLVLSGPQGTGKSTFLEKLLPPALEGYMFSGQIDPGDKDSKAYLAEKLLINLEELDHISGKKEAELKSLITETKVDYRRPYGTYSKSYPRHASFCSSVNHEAVLSDSTGSRRFLMIKIKAINYSHSISMDRVWSQAYSLFKSGFQYWFDAKDNDRINVSNEDYQIMSVEEEMLLNEYDQASSTDPMGRAITPTELLKRLYDSKLPTNSHGAKIRLGKALVKHGFISKKIKGQKKWIVKQKHCDWVHTKVGN